MMSGDSVEKIQTDFLRGIELVVDSFNRLLAWHAPVIPVATSVTVERVGLGPDQVEK
jgi:hypothetical protein